MGCSGARVPPDVTLGEDAGLQKRLRQCQDALVPDTTPHPLQKSGMRDLIETRRDVVIDDDGQVALVLAMRHLVDADPPQPVKQIDLAGPRHRRVRRSSRLSATRSASTPRRRTSTCSRPAAPSGLERAREPRVVPGPRDGADHHAVTTTCHPRRVGLHETPTSCRDPAHANAAAHHQGHTPGCVCGRPRNAHTRATPA